MDVATIVIHAKQATGKMKLILFVRSPKYHRCFGVYYWQERKARIAKDNISQGKVEAQLYQILLPACAQ